MDKNSPHETRDRHLKIKKSFRLSRVIFIEIDTGGSWLPRCCHHGALRRWIIGPLSFGFIKGTFSGLTSVFKEMALKEINGK